MNNVVNNKVVIYARVSTNEQSTSMQINDLKDYLLKRGWDLQNIYEDKISGDTKFRPELNKLIDDAKKRKFDIVLVWKFDRFARSLKMLVDSLELFKELNIDFVSYKENIDTTTTMGRLIFNINSAYSEFEKELIKDRVKSGVANKRANMLKEGDNSWGRKELDPLKRLKIKKLKDLGKSIRIIAKELQISKTTVLKYL
jgi:DNA invertase Pin-like site-specific DNA recombinase